LAPGFRVPDFSFTTQEGDSINSSTLIGKPYIIEITPVASRLYQDQYDRTVVIHQIYQNYDLEIFTIPLDRSEVTVNAFFEERVKHWGVAAFGTFDIQKLIETFNVTDVPTRILVDQNGNIVRKYVASEFTDVIQGMNTVINQSKIES
jgi:glutathione peroxidase-family protein